jgi:hypothetical protein
MAAGDFSATTLVKVTQKADSMWADSQLAADYVSNAETLKAVISEQTARLTMVEDPEKDYDVRLDWMNACDETTDAGSNDCTIGGAELESGSKSYKITGVRHYGFNVKEKLFRGNSLDMDEAIAKGFLKADKVLSEYIAKAGVSFIEANEGTNTYDGQGYWTINGTETDVAAANLTVGIMPHLLLAGQLNKMTNPFILSGTNLYIANWNALIDQPNGEGKGNAARVNTIRKYFDVFNIDVTNSPAFKTYLIDRGALAFASKAYYGATPTVYKTQDRWSIASRNVPGLRYDVVYTNECASNEIVHKFSVYARYNYFLNPTGCTATRTGILTFKKV